MTAENNNNMYKYIKPAKIQCAIYDLSTVVRLNV